MSSPVTFPMKYSCIANFNYFDTPEFFLLCMHIVTVISVPIHCFGMYCIIYKTPIVMKTVKWYLFTLHFWIIAFDYSFSFLTVPFLLIPKLGGYILGILKYTSMPLDYLTIIVMGIGAYMGISIVSIFENRFYIVCDFGFKNHWAVLRRIWLAIHYVIVPIFLTPIVFLTPDQKTAIPLMFQKLPCLPKYIYDAPVLALSESLTYHATIAVVYIFLVLIESFIFVGYLIFNIIKQMKEHKMSPKTFELQKKFIITLLIQVSIPMICFICTLIYIGFAYMINYYNQGLNNTTLAIFSCHGSVSTIALILLHAPYREYARELLRKLPRRNPVEVSQSQIANLSLSNHSNVVVTV